MFRDNLSVPSWISWPLKWDTIGCPKTSARIYQYALRNIPVERRFKLEISGFLEIEEGTNASIKMGRMKSCFYVVNRTGNNLDER